MKTIQHKYQELKVQYDKLLEKNQNDLIKIKIREKQLNEKIMALQRQKEEEVRHLKGQIEKLLKENSELRENRAIISVQASSSINNQNESDIRYKQLEKSNSQNIKKISDLQQKIISLNMEIQAMSQKTTNCEKQINEKDLIISVNKQSEKSNLERIQKTHKQQLKAQSLNHINQLSSLKKQYQQTINALTNQKQKISSQKSQLQFNFSQSKQKFLADKENLNSQIALLKQRLQLTNDSLKLNLQKQKKLELTLKIREQDKQRLTGQLQQSKKHIAPPEQKQAQCYRCKQLAQQVDLHKQMIKSVKMMLKFKQMQLQKLK